MSLMDWHTLMLVAWNLSVPIKGRGCQVSVEGICKQASQPVSIFEHEAGIASLCTHWSLTQPYFPRE